MFRACIASAEYGHRHPATQPVIQVSRPGHDSDKAIVALHDETLHIRLLFRSHLPRAAEHILELPTFENDCLETDLSQKVAIVER
jgi:hypothetical protein